MKRLIFLFAILVSTICTLNNVFAQDKSKELPKKEIKTEKESKLELFTSKTGELIKFVDHYLNEIKFTNNDYVSLKIRKFTIKSQSYYFYQIKMVNKYSSPIASIEYSDLIEVIKAFNSLKLEFEKDKGTKPSHLENKFATEDGFQIGYYVENDKASWFLKLEKYGTDNTLFINDTVTLENSLLEAKSKIEELKKQ